MNEDEAFIRAIVDDPGDDTPRLVYADWLDDRDDPRGPYLRAEHEAIVTGGIAQFRETSIRLDPVWVARVSRPPVGVCIETPQFRRADAPTTEEEIGAIAAKFGVVFPPEYRAFLLNYNGGCIYSEPPDSGEDAEVEGGFWGIGEGEWCLHQAAARSFDQGHESNRRSGLFPIRAGDVGRMCYLLGVGLVGGRENNLFGRVYSCYSNERQWTANDDFIEVQYWDHKATDSFPELFSGL